MGSNYEIHNYVNIEPPFRSRDGFLKSAQNFFISRLTRELPELKIDELDPHALKDLKQLVKDTICQSSSIWLLQMVKSEEGDDIWYTEIVGGVVYISEPPVGSRPRAVFIQWLSVVEDYTPAISSDIYLYQDFIPLLPDAVGHITTQLSSPLAHIRLRVIFLCLLQGMNPLPPDGTSTSIPIPSVPTHLYLQAKVGSAAYGLSCRYGFKYSTFHRDFHDGSPNPSWPQSTDLLRDLPLDLARKVTFYHSGTQFHSMRVLVLEENIGTFYPPTQQFGHDSLSDEERVTFEKWSHSCMLPDPPVEMSCNYSPNCKTPDTFSFIKEAFRDFSAPQPQPGSDEPIPYTDFVDFSSSEDYVLAGDVEQVEEAFNRLDVFDHGTGYGIDHSVERQYDLPSNEIYEVLDSAACFWVATFHALYGDFYAMNYIEFKINILDLLHRFMDIHPSNVEKKDNENWLSVALEEAGVRPEPVETEITEEEYQRLWAYECDDNHMATSASQRLVNTHFLIPRFEEKETTLLQFTVKRLRTKEEEEEEKKEKKKKKTNKRRREEEKEARQSANPPIIVQCMSSSIKQLLTAEDAGTAQYYAIVNINGLHYINIIAPRIPKTREHQTSDGKLCRSLYVGRQGNVLPLVHDPDWKKKQGLEKVLELQQMYWDGSVHWGRLTKKSPAVPLNPKWVCWVWPTEEERLEWMSKINEWVELSPGALKHHTPHPSGSLLSLPNPYVQTGATCLASSFASVLELSGYSQVAHNLQLKALSRGVGLVQEFVNVVNASKPRDGEGRLLSLKKHKDNKYDIVSGPWPAAVILQGTDFSNGHAISVSDSYIIDSNWPFALPRTAASLDWCCFPAKYKCPHKVYVLEATR